MIHPRKAFEVIWIAWFVSWMAASFWSGRTEKRATTRETWVYRFAIFAGAILMLPWTTLHLIGAKRMWEIGNIGTYTLAAVILASLLLSWFARIHLGRLWSSSLTPNQYHRSIYTVPYAFVPHP